MKNTNYIYGVNPVTEAIKSEKVEIEKIFVAFGLESLYQKIYKQSKSKKIPCVLLDKKKFSKIEKEEFGLGVKTQGVMALTRPFKLYSIVELIEKTKNITNPIFVALDEISDPHNFGSIARSAECSGCSGVIITERNSAPITPTAIKISAGALEHIPVAKVTNLQQSLKVLKDNGFWIIGTDADAERVYTDEIYNSPIVIVIGSEGKGMRLILKKDCDFLVKIPLKGKVTSLNASVSAAVILFEIQRQRSLIK